MTSRLPGASAIKVIVSVVCLALVGGGLYFGWVWLNTPDETQITIAGATPTPSPESTTTPTATNLTGSLQLNGSNVVFTSAQGSSSLTASSSTYNLKTYAGQNVKIEGTQTGNSVDVTYLQVL